ncbi:MAG: hypothetical protein JW902_09980 [Syntrophaceae bacterium]|nr:hypothetical protein [Syntrophaceae bacterium]
MSGKETSEVIEKEERDAVSPRIVKVDSFNNPAWGGSGVGSSKGSRLSPMTVRVRYDRIGLNSVNKSVTYPIGLQQAMGEKIKAGARSSSESVSLLALFIDKQEPCCHKSVYGKQGIILAPLTIRI